MKWIRPVLIFVPLALFFNDLHGTWILDDHYQVERNPFIHSFEHLPRIFSTRVWESSSQETLGSDIYRPIFLTSYMVDYLLFGPGVVGFHVTNNLLHAFNVLLLFLLAVRFLPIGTSVVCALLFAVHPIVTESVAWIGGRMDLLVTLFSLLTIHVLVQLLETPPKSRWLVLTLILLVPLGVFSKETYVLIPFGVLAVLSINSGRSRKDVQRIAGVMGILSLTVILCLLWRHQIVQRPFASLFGLENVRNVVALFHRFLWLFVAPSDLDFFFTYEPTGPVAAHVILVFIVAAGALGGLYWLGRRDRALGIGLCLMVLPMVPVALVVDILGVLNERYFYLPFAGFCLTLAALVQRLKEPVNLKVSRGFRIATKTGLALWLLGLATVTFVRNSDWSDEVTLYSASMIRNPTNYLPHYYLAAHYQRTGERTHEMRSYARALERKPDHLPSLNNLAVREIERGDFPDAKRHLETALAIAPNRPKTHYNIGFYFDRKGETTKAIASYRRALELDPAYGMARTALIRLHAEAYVK